MPFPIDIQYINETETELGVQFPDKFKSKMTIENGGEILTDEDEWQLCPFFDKSDNKRISRTSNHIVGETKQARQWDSFSTNAIAIATNGGGDQLILLPLDDNSKKLKEEIYLWLHETGEVTELANSINDLTGE